jgi:spectrin beta, non-erythrocytic 2
LRHSELPKAEAFFAELKSQGFESVRSSEDRQNTLATVAATVDKRSTAIRPALEDHLARERFRESIVDAVHDHARLHQRCSEWLEERRAFLARSFDLSSVPLVQVAVVALTAHEARLASARSTFLRPLAELTARITAAKYESQFSRWSYPRSTDLSKMDESLTTALDSLTAESLKRKATLEDVHKRLAFIEDVHLRAAQHRAKYQQLDAWLKDRTAFVEKREPVPSSTAARYLLSMADALVREMVGVLEAVDAQITLGETLAEAAYSSPLSEWKFEGAETVARLDKDLERRWDALEKALRDKRVGLEDDLARATFAETARLRGEACRLRCSDLERQLREKLAYAAGSTSGSPQPRSGSSSSSDVALSDGAKSGGLAVTAPGRSDSASSSDDLTNGKGSKPSSSAAVRCALSELETRERDVAQLAADVKAQRLVCDDACAAIYQSPRSKWSWEERQIARDEQDALEALLAQVLGALKGRRALLEDDLQRTLFAEDIVQSIAQHCEKCRQLQSWISERLVYAKQRAAVRSSRDAKSELSLLGALKRDMKHYAAALDAELALGETLCEAAYSSPLSHWQYDRAAEVRALDAALEKLWAALEKQVGEKEATLQDDLARELFAEDSRLLLQQYDSKDRELMGWLGSTLAQVEKRDESRHSSSARRVLNALAILKRDVERMGAVVAAQGELLGRLHKCVFKSSRSAWSISNMKELEANFAALKQQFDSLPAAIERKRELLEDDLARLLCAETTRLHAGQHESKFEELDGWMREKAVYASKEETAASVYEAKANLYVLQSLQSDMVGRLVDVDTQVALGETIVDASYSSQLSQWRFEGASDVANRDASLEDSWDALEQLVATKRAALADTVERLTFAETTRMLANQCFAQVPELEGVISRVRLRLLAQWPVRSLGEARIAVRVWQSLSDEVGTELQAGLAELAGRAREVAGRKFASALSSYAYERMSELDGVVARLQSGVNELHELLRRKRDEVGEAMRREQSRQEMSVGFATSAEQLMRTAADTCSWAQVIIGVTGSPETTLTWGGTLADVRVYQGGLQREMNERQTRMTQLMGTCRQLWEDVQKRGGIVANTSPHTLETVSVQMRRAGDSGQSVSDLGMRVLARFEKHDSQGRQVANLVEPVMERIGKMLSVLLESGESAESQRSQVQRFEESAAADLAQLPAIREGYQRLAVFAVPVNIYSTTGLLDVEILAEQGLTVLREKRELLDAELEYQRLRGLSADQFQEIERVFRMIDRGRKGVLDRASLRACLFALGEERRPQEIDRLLAVCSPSRTTTLRTTQTARTWIATTKERRCRRRRKRRYC